MILKSYRRALLVVTAGLVAGGCMPMWRPPAPATQPAATRPVEAQKQYTVADYLRAWRGGRSVYQRRELTTEGLQPAQRYERYSRSERISEGTLVNIPLLKLDAYLQAEPEPSIWGPPEPKPVVPLGKVFWVFFDLTEPMNPLPPEIADGQPVVTTTTLRYIDRLGRSAAKGTLTRTAVLEGYENVTCPAGRFDRCMRARVDFEVRFPLVLSINWNTYLWLSPEVGEVRRVQQFTGWFLLFWFGSAHEFLLESYTAPASRPAVPATCWSRGLVQLGRKLPRPQIEGVVVDVVASQPGP